ncbi:MAG TPA: glycosyltransferase [Candidatus Binataceae bacterium]|nr:glycosyltransferase [Candidatus Binataceae bacterium]
MRLADIRSALDLSQRLVLRHRLQDLQETHTTALVLSEEQAESVLDLATYTGLHALVELAVKPEDLLEPARARQTAARIVRTVNIWRNHPALIGYLIDCPIAPERLRMLGLERVQRALGRIIREIHLRDRRALVALKHRPATVALAAAAEDFLYAEVGGFTPAELAPFVIALHNLAMARPVVIEFPQAVAGQGPEQDELVATAFGVGAAGVVAPPVCRPAVADWLAMRPMGADEASPFISLNGTCPPRPSRTPMVSVVICAYNAERTMLPCLESLGRLKYPNYEVVIVDDGSRDRTAEIAMRFPEFRLIRQPNKGLSVARNVGLFAARGEIVAYTDSDCVVDPDWLTLMVRAMVEGGLDGCGGPNYAPHEEGRVEGCVAAAPGAPCHVLVADDRAEHLAGCNMVFSKASLVAVGGFDAQFTSAGDDVDICWRFLDAGFTLGYCPAAFVWHFRRNTVKAYYGQQRGYGRAEAALYLKYPERFNALGQIKWRGTIPGLVATVPGALRRRIGWTRAACAVQTVRDEVPGILSFLPQTLEWNLVFATVTVFAWFAGLSMLPALTMLALGLVWALHYAWQAPLEKCHDSLGSRLFVACLAWSGPMVRTWTRWKTRMRTAGLGDELRPRQRPALRWLERSLHLSYWNEAWTTRESLLERLTRGFSRAGCVVTPDRGWNDFDLEVRPDPWTRLRLKTADEEHEGARLKNHVAVRVRLSRLSHAGLAIAASATVLCAAMGLSVMAAVLTALTMASAMCAVSQAVESGRLAYHAVEQCAQELNLIPLGKPTAAARRAAASARPSAAPEAVASSTKLFADNRIAAE